MSDSKRFAPKLHIKKGDNVMVIAGSNKGLKGEVKLVLTKENRAVVDGVNMVKKHIKSTPVSYTHLDVYKRQP